jgi:uncharacterized LabA/DUF88 family protein
MTIVKHSEQRVAVLIDTNNLYHSAKSLFKRRVNFANLLDEAVAGRNLIRAIAYTIRTDSEDESSFFEALNDRGIETKSKDIQIFYDGTKKADWDVGVTIDAIRLAPRLDAIILASGDGDYVPLVEHLKATYGIQVEVIAFWNTTSASLREHVDDFVDLSLDRERFLIPVRSPKKSMIQR